MSLFFVAIFSILFIAVWGLLYTLLTTDSRIKIAGIVTMIVIFLSPFLMKVSVEFDRKIFAYNALGEVSLSSSVFKRPQGSSPDYCKRFIKNDGKEIDITSVDHDGNVYCGYFVGMYSDTHLMIPYNKTGKGIEYWAGPGNILVDTLSQDPLH
jgi:hypothetical protein